MMKIRESDQLSSWIIHIDICESFPTITLSGQQYCISFIDDFSQYGYIFLIRDKASTIDMFKLYKTEVEKQHIKKIKIVRSDHGSQFYDKYDETG